MFCIIFCTEEARFCDALTLHILFLDTAEKVRKAEARDREREREQDIFRSVIKDV